METTQQAVSNNSAPIINGSADPSQNPGFSRFNFEAGHSFIVALDPKVPEMEGYRVAKLTYRETKEGTKVIPAKPAKMVTLPNVVFDADQYLMPESAVTVLKGIIEDQQDVFIRGVIDTPESNKRINWDDVSVDKMLAALTATRVSTRLNKEAIETWVRGNVTLLASMNARSFQICEAKGYQPDSTEAKQQKAGTINAYSDKFSRLAAPVPNLGQGEATALQNMLIMSKVQDDMSKALQAKLTAILKPAIESADL